MTDNGDGEGVASALGDYLTRLEFMEYKDHQNRLCDAYREGMRNDLKALRNLFIGSLSISTLIITLWQYILTNGVI